MKGLMTHLGLEFKTGIRDKSLLLMNYLFPLSFYAMMGLIMTKIHPEFYTFMIPSMSVFAALAATIIALPTPIVGARESGIYRSYKINGVPLSGILSIVSVSTMLHMAVVAVIIALSAPAVFDAVAPKNWGYFALTYFAFLFACTGLAVLIGVCSQSTKTTILLAQLIFVPSVVIGGIMIPVESLSGSMADISRIFPSTHAMNAFKALCYNLETPFSAYGSISVLFASGIIAFLLSGYLFSWDNMSFNSKRNLLGLLAIVPYAISVFIF